MFVLPPSTSSYSVTENDNNLVGAARMITPPNIVYLPSASSTMHDGKQN